MLDIKTFMEQIVPDGVDRMKGGGGGKTLLTTLTSVALPFVPLSCTPKTISKVVIRLTYIVLVLDEYCVGTHEVNTQK